ncbi:MAG: histidinol-phosphate aminotransferase family protein [Chloroflexi bacterium]|nr:histidinol-phosphate aminotransferase family protein [Chloroflexota bacterium]
MEERRRTDDGIVKEAIILPRAELRESEGAVHGAFDYAELARFGLDAGAVIDFSANSNPFGPTPAVTAALAAVDPACYPDRECLALRRALADHLCAAPDEIVAGNGAAEILWLIAFAFLRRGERVLIVGPTFGEYARMAQLMGAEIVHWRATAADGFAVDAGSMAARIDATQPRIVFLCNPNNPTGAVVEAGVLAAWAAASPQILFVIDEAYIAFTDGMPSAHALRLPNLLVVRSMTKEYALAGLRLGYALGPPALIAGLAAARVPWNVNAYAQAAGLAALGDAAYLQRTLAQLRAAKSDLLAGLIAQGYAPLPSATNFFLLPVEDGARLRAHLLAQGVLVRDCASFGLPHHIRIAARRPEENAKLLNALEKTKDNGRKTNA